MDTTTVAITIGSVISTKAFALWRLWLRLRWRSRREQDRQDYLLGIAEKVAAGSRVELDDQDRDGHRLRVSIFHVEAHKEDTAG
ncbi:hypothetical protein GT034_30380 [Streptomyces sp. SID2563]|uniref:hypothetical protein n=1 Tax=Streptomyces sp. SID2563 TaxID=2690255 RepID=UPI001371D8CA|nr:hypothetical protein [Streptomyces sp. SID2563]MYW12621.1 hypothetical protein [Streptomyces sp. SID2563]